MTSSEDDLRRTKSAAVMAAHFGKRSDADGYADLCVRAAKLEREYAKKLESLNRTELAIGSWLSASTLSLWCEEFDQATHDFEWALALARDTSPDQVRAFRFALRGSDLPARAREAIDQAAFRSWGTHSDTDPELIVASRPLPTLDEAKDEEPVPGGNRIASGVSQPPPSLDEEEGDAPGLRRNQAARAIQARIVRENGAWLTRYCERILNGRFPVEDAVQEIWLRFTANPDFEFRSEPELRRFLALMARRITIDLLRRVEHRVVDPLEAATVDEMTERADSDPLSEASRRETSVRISLALLALGQKERRLLELRYFEGLSFDEVGVRLGVSPTTAAQRCRRLLRRVSESL